jgi:hypothetical protein
MFHFLFESALLEFDHYLEIYTFSINSVNYWHNIAVYMEILVTTVKQHHNLCTKCYRICCSYMMDRIHLFDLQTST